MAKPFLRKKAPCEPPRFIICRSRAFERKHREGVERALVNSLASESFVPTLTRISSMCSFICDLEGLVEVLGAHLAVSVRDGTTVVLAHQFYTHGRHGVHLRMHLIRVLMMHCIMSTLMYGSQWDCMVGKQKHLAYDQELQVLIDGTLDSIGR